MPTFNPDPRKSVIAGSNVKNFCGVLRVAANTVNGVTTQGGAIDGVAMDYQGVPAAAYSAGDAVPLCEGGVVPAMAGAAIADNAEVMVDTDCMFITFSAGGGKLAVGKVANGGEAVADGDVFSLQLYARTAQHV